jgi:hypothetical protein
MKSISRFADAAGRLDRFVAEIKARQYDGTGTLPLPPPQPGRGHPDAQWQQHYGTRSIRAGRTSEMTFTLPEDVLPVPAGPRRPNPAVETPGTPVATKINGPIGAALGKPIRRRSFLGRLLRGRDN